MQYGLLVVALLFAACDWVAVARDRRRLEMICKPATMVAVVFAVLTQAWAGTPGFEDEWLARFFVPAFTLSLIGDVFLMLRRERLFLAGLGAFLLAHVCYIIGLNATTPPWPSVAVLVPVAGGGTILLQRLAEGLRRRGQKRMLAPVAMYSVVLSLMLYSAWTTLLRPEWGKTRAWLAAIGASLFFISDSMLAWDRFVTSFPKARLWIHVTYHLGQMALAASVLGP